MSAAATAAGYLYASGRLRGRQSKDQEDPRQPQAQRPDKEVRVATMPSTQDARPKRQPTIQYRTRRWRPDDPGKPE
jgi:hypothetical protein